MSGAKILAAWLAAVAMPNLRWIAAPRNFGRPLVCDGLPHHGTQAWEQSFLEIMPGNVWVLAIKRAEAARIRQSFACRSDGKSYPGDAAKCGSRS